MYADELKQKVIQLKGIGKGNSEALGKIGITTVADLLRYIPRAYENRLEINPLASYQKGAVNTIVEVIGHDYMGFGSKRTLKVYVKDTSGTAVLVCFGRNFLSQKLVVGKKFFLYGNFEYKFQEIQTSSFEVEEFSKNPSVFNCIIPIYPLRDRLTQGIFRRTIAGAISELARYTNDQLPKNLIQNYGFIKRSSAVKNIHFPDSIEMLQKAEQLLRYEELFYLQLSVGRKSKEPRISIRTTSEKDSLLQQKLIEGLGFNLTPDQLTVLEEIKKDMISPYPMARLLQGDVGSGKTLIAFLAALRIIQSGGQVAFMAPTELLARQHAENAAKLMEPLGVRLAFLRGNIKDKRRKPLIEALRNGEIDLIVGTHALFTKNVEFRNLEFVIVDEQHKFGVDQRQALLKKGDKPDLLLMTATPIPRTLTLTLFGNMDVSTIKTMPLGRKPVITHLSAIGKEAKVYSAVQSEIEKGHQAYFVYPRIEEGNSSSLKDAEGMYRFLREEIFPEYRVGLIHSQLPEEEKIKTMERFSSGYLHILVSTSVVEVGVDIPNATCMVIEHAEQFGLSGLHQLRGRVGRGTEQSYAFLVYGKELSESGKQRLKIMMDYNDGFSISEEDLKLRGSGELAGRRQSGFLNLTYADLVRDFKILEKARKDAFLILENDPGFLKAENIVIREVFDRCKPFKGAVEDE